MELQSVALYHPEDVIASRLPGGAGELSTLIQQLVRAMATEYARDGATSRALVVAITPNHQAYWILDPTGAADERVGARASLAAIARPHVVGGPIAFALFLRHGEDYPSTGDLPIPAEWAEAARQAGTPLGVDEILTALLR